MCYTMLFYLVKRLLFFIPTLILISVVAFFLSKTAPGDPVDLYHQGGLNELATAPRETQRVYRDTRALLGLDKPTFYFSLTAKAYPDTLYRIQKKDQRQVIRKLIRETGNWPALQAAYQATNHLNVQLTNHTDSAVQDTYLSLRSEIQDVFTTDQPKRLAHKVDRISSALAPFSSTTDIQNFTDRWTIFFDQPQRQLLYQPRLYWFGWNNQYHQWIRSILRGEFGRSFRDGQPAGKKILQALRWTLLINGLAILLAYGLSIPLGVSMATRQNSPYDRTITVLLFVLYALPSFWIGTLLLIVFTNPDYGLQFFSITRINETVTQGSFGQQIWLTLKQVTLPVFCLVYGSLAFIARQMRGGMLEVINQDFIRTARAKGLPARKVIWKHAFRNALFPLITLFASLFPSLLAGSVVIEVIFNIPGMGKLTVDSIQNQDWPVVYILLLLSAALTMLGILVADLLYALADPRVKYQKKGKP